MKPAFSDNEDWVSQLDYICIWWTFHVNWISENYNSKVWIDIKYDKSFSQKEILYGQSVLTLLIFWFSETFLSYTDCLYVKD